MMSEIKQPVTPKGAIIFCVFLLFLFLIFKCSCSESKPIENKPITEKETNYDNAIDNAPESTIDGHTTDELFEVYHYIYSKGNVIEAETNVLFVEGKNDELQVTVDMPNGKTFEYYLKNKVDLGTINGLDSYLYTTDEGEKINVSFKNGREMMGFVAGKQDFVFMNTPDYKE